MKFSLLLALTMAVSFCVISQVEAKSVRGYWRKHPHLHYVTSYHRSKSHSPNRHHHHH